MAQRQSSHSNSTSQSKLASPLQEALEKARLLAKWGEDELYPVQGESAAMSGAAGQRATAYATLALFWQQRATFISEHGLPETQEASSVT